MSGKNAKVRSFKTHNPSLQLFLEANSSHWRVQSIFACRVFTVAVSIQKRNQSVASNRKEASGLSLFCCAKTWLVMKAHSQVSQSNDDLVIPRWDLCPASATASERHLTQAKQGLHSAASCELKKQIRVKLIFQWLWSQLSWCWKADLNPLF